jgi:hypothetical protein
MPDETENPSYFETILVFEMTCPTWFAVGTFNVVGLYVWCIFLRRVVPCDVAIVVGLTLLIKQFNDKISSVAALKTKKTFLS